MDLITIPPGLLSRCMRAIGGPQRGLADALGISTRTLSRWFGGAGSPSPQQFHSLARALFSRDPALAAEVAALAGATLEALGTSGASGVTQIDQCPTQSPGRGCGSPDPAPDGTPIVLAQHYVTPDGVVTNPSNGCWPWGGGGLAAPCGNGAACNCPLACVGGTCMPLSNAACLGRSSSSSSGSSSGSSSSSSSGGCDSCTGPTVDLNGTQTLGCWVALQPPASQGLYAEICNSNAFTCGYSASVEFYMNRLNEPTAGSCPPLAAGAVYSLTDPTMNADCIQVVAGEAATNGWEGQAGVSWSGSANVIFGFPLPPPSCTNCGSCASCVGEDAGIYCGVGICLNCLPAPEGSLTITSLDPFTVEISGDLFSTQSIDQFPPACPFPRVVSIVGTMSSPLLQSPSNGGAGGGSSSSGSSSSSSSSSGGGFCN